ncbi:MULTISPECIES: AraC family transcriptional regulator [Chryseobacterium]|uniref:AraC-type DNA-binding protein n=1 Tax=Chryseobacterium wanjuense TaxID=356305 RepID=A0A1I0R0G1_9FLAO|nr:MULTISPECIES: AraC family transcriptional regulator [Chryseobacterium]KYH08258.1 hypothetical protein A1704_06280 [Chryseobacterium cucumeris]SEW33485.1 AraC-type DNA-binding protein [Chryseobacterium wanjuense]
MINSDYSIDDLHFTTRSIDGGNTIIFNKQMIFSIIYIIKGEGKYQVQHNTISYGSNDIFIVVPGEEFQVIQTTSDTEILEIKFSDLFINQKKQFDTDRSDRTHILYSANQNLDYIVNIKNNIILAHQIANCLLSEIREANIVDGEYLKHLVYMILLFLEKEIKKLLPSIAGLTIEQKVIKMLQYIHLNIFEPKKLTIQELSDKFFISPTYIGKYFKSHTNHNLHHYILQYKLNLIQYRLKNSNMRVSEIADEFGFSDKSYLNKIFLKYTGISPSQYRINSKNKNFLSNIS